MTLDDDIQCQLRYKLRRPLVLFEPVLLTAISAGISLLFSVNRQIPLVNSMLELGLHLDTWIWFALTDFRRAHNYVTVNSLQG